MSVTVDQIIKLYVAGLLSGTGTQGDPIILDDLPANTVIGDLGGGTGAITIDQLKTALNLGGGNAGVRALNVIVSDGSDLIDLEQWAFDYWQIDLNAVSATTLSITDPLTTAVPLIHLHFINLVGDVDVTFPASMKDANGDALGTHTLTQGQIVPFYYANGNYYTNYLTIAGGTGNITQGGTGVSISDITGADVILASLKAGTGASIVRQGEDVIISFSGFGYESEYQAVLDYASAQTITPPAAPVQLFQNQMVADLVSEGIWTKIQLMYIFQQGASMEDFSRLNWKNPSQFALADVGNGVNWDIEGIQAVDANSCLNTQFNLVDHGSTLDKNISIATMLASDHTAGIPWGIQDAANDYMLVIFGDGGSPGKLKSNLFCSANLATAYNDDLLFADINAQESMIHTRSGADNKAYLGGTLIGTEVGDKDLPSPGAVINNLPLYLAGRNNIGGAISGLTANHMQSLIVAEALTDSEAAALAGIMETYSTAV